MIAGGGEITLSRSPNRVLSEASVNEFFKIQVPDSYVVNSPIPPNLPFQPYPSDTIRYGLGTWLDVVNPENNSIEQISSPGAFGTYPFFDRKRNVYGIILTRSSLSAVFLTELRILEILRTTIDETNQ